MHCCLLAAYLKLTATKIKNISYDQNGPAKQRHWDEACPGLALEIFKTGKKSFIYRYRLNGKQKFLTIGDVLITDLDYARDTANDYARMVRRGDDPKFPANIGDDMTVRALVCRSFH